MKQIVLLISLLFLFNSCRINKAPFYEKEHIGWNDSKLPQQDNLIHTLYLVGGVGSFNEKSIKQNHVIDHLTQELKGADKHTTLVYLGDNIKPKRNAG